MQLIKTTLLCATLSLASLSAQANLELADKNACLNCHAEAKKLVGPSFNDIAAKYKDRKDAAAYLTEKINKGSTGVWGQIPMPGMPQVSAEEAKSMVGWILKQP